MKTKFFISTLFTISLILTSVEISFAQATPTQKVTVENKISNNNGLLGTKLDYQLLATDNRKFVLKITNSIEENVKVQIYDVIGNLILTDDLSESNNGEKEYDFSDRKTKIFVVKVGAGEENLTKKITI